MPFLRKVGGYAKDIVTDPFKGVNNAEGAVALIYTLFACGFTYFNYSPADILLPIPDFYVMFDLACRDTGKGLSERIIDAWDWLERE